MKIGIIGGGQLGMMMAEEAKILGHKIVSLDPNPNCSIVKFSDCHIAKDYNDYEVLEYMNETCDVITYEFENVDLDVLKKFINKIPQKTEALRISRDRLIEKGYANTLGIRTPEYIEVKRKEDVFFPSIVKTTTGGYDGKGQYKITNKSQIDQIYKLGEIPYICEELIEFDYEISVVATRDQNGNFINFPVPKNIHKNGILHISIVEDEIPVEVTSQAIDFTRKLMKSLEYVGTLAVEYFVLGDKVIFNEFAPRPHNSGHYTQDGCNVSQFKNHILAITGENVIEPVLKDCTVMINVLGQNMSYYANSEGKENHISHDYYKNSTRENRKIGHINVTYNTKDKRDNIIRNIIKE